MLCNQCIISSWTLIQLASLLRRLVDTVSMSRDAHFESDNVIVSMDGREESIDDCATLSLRARSLRMEPDRGVDESVRKQEISRHNKCTFTHFFRLPPTPCALSRAPERTFSTKCDFPLYIFRK